MRAMEPHRDRPGRGNDDSDDRWWPGAWSALEALAASGRTFDADDLRQMAGDPPATCLIGRIFGLGSRHGLIVREGYEISERRSRRYGVRATWRGAR